MRLLSSKPPGDYILQPHIGCLFNNLLIIERRRRCDTMRHDEVDAAAKTKFLSLKI